MIEEGQDDPVSEPLGVVILGGGLQGLDGAVGRVGESDSVHQELQGQMVRETEHKIDTST